MKVGLTTAFVFSFVALLFCSIFFPSLHLLFFTPFLALASLRFSLIGALWLGLLAGISVDLFSSQLFFGVTALNYSLTLLLASMQKRNFIEDKPLSFSIFAAFISFLSSTIQMIFHALFDQKIPLSLPLLCTDLLVMPLLDGFYAQMILFFPFYLWRCLCSIRLRREDR